MTAGILNDLTKCSGCGACALACQQINGLPAVERPSKLSETTFTFVRQSHGVNIRRNCMHCLDPTCASACPVGALHKTSEGPVVYDESRCIGCRYCMLACPFNVPTYEWHSVHPGVRKCSMCFENRVRHGEQPACTSVCPTGATLFGERDALVEEAKRRIATAPDRYVDHIYGLQEAGGTSVLFLSGIPFEDLGFATKLGDEPFPKLTWNILSRLPNVVGIGGVALAGIYWVISRRMMMERMNEGHAFDEEAVDDTRILENGGEL